MSHRVVEVGNPSYLRYEPGHLVVEQDGAVVGRLPIEGLGFTANEFAPRSRGRARFGS